MWRFTQERIDDLVRQKRIVATASGIPTSSNTSMRARERRRVRARELRRPVLECPFVRAIDDSQARGHGSIPRGGRAARPARRGRLRDYVG